MPLKLVALVLSQDVTSALFSLYSCWLLQSLRDAESIDAPIPVFFVMLLVFHPLLEDWDFFSPRRAINVSWSAWRLWLPQTLRIIPSCCNSHWVIQQMHSKLLTVSCAPCTWHHANHPKVRNAFFFFFSLSCPHLRIGVSAPWRTATGVS